MYIFSIDPSFVTGWAYLESDRSRLPVCLACGGMATFPEDGTELERIDTICVALALQHRKCRELFGCNEDGPRFALEDPGSPNSYTRYTRKDGSKGARILTNAWQWRLIGRLEEWASSKGQLALVSPAEAKLWLGLPRTATKDEVVAKTTRMVDGAFHRLGELPTKAMRQAAADAIAVGCYGFGAHRRDAIVAASERT